MQKVTIGERTFFLPFVDVIPISAEDDAALGASIEAAGRIREPVVSWKDKRTSNNDWIIDGAHRVLHAARLGFKKVPVRIESAKTEEEARRICVEQNAHRRQMTPEQLLEHRNARIIEARQDGKSLRQIAEEQGVSKDTVARELEKAAQVSHHETPDSEKPAENEDQPSENDQNGPPAATVTGRDGKAYRAKKPEWEKKLAKLLAKGKVTEDRAAEIRAIPLEADRLKVIDHLAHDCKTTTPEEDAAEVKDDAGLPIPEHVLPAFEGRKEIRRVGRLFDSLIHEVEALKTNPGINPGILNGIVASVKNGKGSLVSNQASHICPYCHARKKKDECNACRGRGWVIKLIYDQAPKGGAK